VTEVEAKAASPQGQWSSRQGQTFSRPRPQFVVLEVIEDPVSDSVFF